MTKPWDMLTYPKDRPIYVRPKQNHMGGGSLIVIIGHQGVAVLDNDKDAKLRLRTMSWTELHAACVTFDNEPCGVKV